MSEDVLDLAPSLANDGFGVAFDLGTTTVVGSVVNLETGETLNRVTHPNPQKEWGADVMSRIRSVKDDPKILVVLQKSVINTCNNIIEELNPEGGVKAITVAGNTVMEHIFVGISPLCLGKVPYKPDFKESRIINAKTLGFNVESGVSLYTFPIIGGYVGGDTVSVLLALDILAREDNIAMIDIGTNSEIVVKGTKGIYSAATPAGPAFEGGEIRDGMVAGKGAVEGFKIVGDSVELKVIGGGQPTGICGSGLIEAVGELIEHSIIDSTGRIKDSSEIETNLANKIKREAEGNVFVFSRGAKGEVALTQPDIRALQFAKGAIIGGLNMLFDKSKTDGKDIKKVYIAGAFGSHLNAKALCIMGILKEEWLDRVEIVGDAALRGAELAIASKEKRREAEKIATDTRYVSLSGSKNFEKEFIEAMNF